MTDAQSGGYHARIMNMQYPKASMLVGDVSAYSLGHRNARHEAAEIATGADIAIATLEAERDRLKHLLKCLVAECSGFEAFEHELRGVMGNSNWNCIAHHAAKARAALQPNGEGQ